MVINEGRGQGLFIVIVSEVASGAITIIHPTWLFIDGPGGDFITVLPQAKGFKPTSRNTNCMGGGY